MGCQSHCPEEHRVCKCHPRPNTYVDICFRDSLTGYISVSQKTQGTQPHGRCTQWMGISEWQGAFCIHSFAQYRKLPQYSDHLNSHGSFRSPIRFRSNYGQKMWSANTFSSTNYKANPKCLPCSTNPSGLISHIMN